MKMDPTDRSPLIEFNEELGTLLIQGKSVHENADGLYTPVQQQVEDHLRTSKKLHVRFDLVYFNTSSSKYFLDIMRTLEDALSEQKADVAVAWEYDSDDIDMKEAGEDYKALLNLPFKLVKKAAY